MGFSLSSTLPTVSYLRKPALFDQWQWKAKIKYLVVNIPF
jgi:hypothetical protein